MQVHRLRLINFRQHEDTDLRFDLGLTGVIGPNGSGKTTLLEALAWAVYGTKAARGTAEGIRRRNAPPRARVEVSLEFTLGPHRYRVVRSLHGAELYQDGDGQAIADSASAVTERLTRILGMTREEFFNTYFTGQKELAIMGSMTPLEREKFLSRVLGYERLQTAKNRLAADRSALRGQVEALEALVVSTETLAAEEAAVARRLTGALAAARDTEAAQAAARREMDRVRPEWERWQRLHEEVLSLESDLRVAEQQVTDGRDAFIRLDRDLAEALTSQKRLEELRPLLAALPALTAERERLDGLAARLARRRETQGQVTELKRRVEAIDERLATLPTPEALTALRSDLEARRSALAEAERLAQEARTKWVRDRQDAQTKQEQLKAQGEDIRKQLDTLRAAGPDGACPVCNRPLGGSYDGVVKDLEAQRAEVAVNYKFFGARGKQLDKEPKEVRDAAKRRDALQGEVAQFTSEVGRADGRVQARSSLEGERTVHVARLEELAALVAEVAEDYDDQRHAAVRAELERLEPLRLESERHRDASDRAARLAADAATAEGELSRREARVAELRHRLQETGWSPEDFARARAAVASADQAHQQAQLAAVRAAGEVENAQADVTRVALRRAERERLVADVRQVEARLLLNQELDRAFADLRSDLNASLRPDLSDLGSHFLRDLTMGRFSEFELDEDYAPTIVEDGEPQTVLSGGEEDVVSLALRLAISQMIAERAGQPLSMLVLDEIFGSLDDERRGAVVDLLRRLADRFPQVILITHVDTVREGFDRVLRMVYDVERGIARVSEERDGGRYAAA